MSTTYQVGDHLVIDRFFYSHHGLFIGSNQVIHYAGESLGSKSQDSTIQIVSLDAFAGQHPVVRRVHLNPVFSPEEAVRRAFSRLGEDEYSVLFNNCEHFVNWCLEGISISEQIEQKKRETQALAKLGYDILRHRQPTTIGVGGLLLKGSPLSLLRLS